MTYLDSISIATQRALDWQDLPDELLPLVITSQASELSAIESEAIGHAGWH